jgi:hypothetical protein
MLWEVTPPVHALGAGPRPFPIGLFLRVKCGWWQNHVCTRRLLACIYGPYSQDLPLSAALVRGCTSAGTRPVAGMVRPPGRADAARSHDFGNEVSQPPDVLRSAARPAAGLSRATLGYSSAAMALGWAEELAPQPLPLGYHVERCRSEVRPSGESGACFVGGNGGGPAPPNITRPACSGQRRHGGNARHETPG